MPRAIQLRTAFHQDERRLPRIDQLDIDLGQQLGIKQGSVLGAARRIDAIAQTKIVEPVRAARIFPPRQQQRVHHAGAFEQRPLGTLELGIEEAHIEGGVVDHQRRVTQKGQQIVGDFMEARLVPQHLQRDAMHPESLFRNVALGVDVMMEDLASGDAVEQLDAADLDQPVPLIRVKAGRFGIEHDLAHTVRLSLVSPANGGRITFAVWAF